MQTAPVDNDITNTTVSEFTKYLRSCLCFYVDLSCALQVFIGNLDPNVTEEELRQIFMPLGDIVYVKIPAAKGCGFVQFAAR